MNLHAELIHTFTGHSGSVYALGQAHGTKAFFSGSGDMTVSAWSLDLVTAPAVLLHVGGIVYAICYVKEKNSLLIGDSVGGIHAMDLGTQQIVRFLPHHTGGVFDIQYSARNGHVYSVSADGSLAIWSLDDFSLLHSIPLCSSKVRSVALKHDETELAVACGDGYIRFIDTISLQVKNSIPAHQLSANCVRYHPDQPLLISGGRDAMLKFWDTLTYQLMESIPSHNYAIYSIAFSYDNHLFATASRDKTLKIWDAETMEFKLRIDKEINKGHSHSVNTVLWLRDGNGLLSAGDDRTIKLWKIKSE